MLDTLKPSPEERLAGYKKSGEEMIVESKRRKSAKEAEANLEARIAGYQKVGEKQKKAAEALAAAKARSEAGKAVWEKRKAEDAKIIEEQRKKIALKAVSGEINLESKLKKSDRAKLDRILEAYEEAENADKFLEFMLENSDIPLTRERVEKDPAVAQYLKSNFAEQELGLRYEDLVQALPTEQDYIDNAMGKVEEAAKPKKTKVISAKSPARTAESVLPPEEVVEEKTETQETFEKAQVAYVKAYREFDPKFTKNKSDDLVAVTRPPFLAFGAKAKELKNLYQAMDIARKNAASEADEEKIRKNLLGARTKAAVNKEALSPEVRAALAKSAQAEEEAAGVKTLSDEAAWYQPEDGKGADSSLVRQAKKESVGSFVDDITLRRGQGIKNRLDKISEYFMIKNKISSKAAHRFLMGAEIKGWLKGKQKQMQKEYWSLFNNPVYKEWQKLQKK